MNWVYGGGSVGFLACLHILLPPTPILTPLSPPLTCALFLFTTLKTCWQEARNYLSAGPQGLGLGRHEKQPVIVASVEPLHSFTLPPNTHNTSLSPKCGPGPELLLWDLRPL